MSNFDVLTLVFYDLGFGVVGAVDAAKQWVDPNGPGDILWEKLFEVFSEEMPYGTLKARTGDPDVWITNKIGVLIAKKVNGDRAR